MQTSSKLALQTAIMSTVLGGKPPRSMEAFDGAAELADAFLTAFSGFVEEINPETVLDANDGWELVSFTQVETDVPKKFIYEHKVLGEVEVTRPASWRRGRR